MSLLSLCAAAVCASVYEIESRTHGGCVFVFLLRASDVQPWSWRTRGACRCRCHTTSDKASEAGTRKRDAHNPVSKNTGAAAVECCSPFATGLGERRGTTTKRVFALSGDDGSRWWYALFCDAYRVLVCVRVRTVNDAHCAHRVLALRLKA